MLSSVFAKNLRDRRRSLVWWLVGVAFLVLITVGFYPSLSEQRESLEQLLRGLPPAMMSMFGMSDVGALFTLEGYLGARLLSTLAPLLFLILGIGAGANAIAGEEERHTLDLLLANPISRRRLVLEQFAALVAVVAIVAAGFWLALYVGAQAFEVEIGAGQLAAGVASVALLGLEFGTLALALGAATGSKGLSIAVSSTLAIASFFLNSFAPLVSWLQPYQKLSPFYHSVGYEPLKAGLDPGLAAALALPALALLTLAVVAFERRDTLA